MQGFRAEILEYFHDSRRNCKGIWKRSSFYRLGGGGYETKDPDFVFKVPFLRLQAGAVISFKKKKRSKNDPYYQG